MGGGREPPLGNANYYCRGSGRAMMGVPYYIYAVLGYSRNGPRCCSAAAAAVPSRSGRFCLRSCGQRAPPFSPPPHSFIVSLSPLTWSVGEGHRHNSDELKVTALSMSFLGLREVEVSDSTGISEHRSATFASAHFDGGESMSPFPFLHN